ncbi:GNAT family N-acetyltransferase [Mucilaginibacter sp. HMF5004]|uniref:GNAT family N-acetyltransferase n=1 Tax=Mucilaginibacter rivuli TaxID=2857527 RepID=UPI001C607E7D|nr:GNAT family N-acetyltransferase [Mucilaginibacter rivuli]MBW4891774.1 GNAT family N-acetyltransferase [Mucilaginibacter rivuli]
MIIRKAILADIPGIMQVISNIVPLMRADGNLQWDDKYPNPEAFQKDIELDQLWVADVDGEIAGAAAVTTEQYPEYADAGLDITETAIVVHRLAVDTKYRGLGIAAALLQQAEQVAVERGITILRIDTNLQNKAAQVLFPKVGYTFAGEIGLVFRPGLRFVCFEKRLK